MPENSRQAGRLQTELAPLRILALPDHLRQTLVQPALKNFRAAGKQKGTSPCVPTGCAGWGGDCCETLSGVVSFVDRTVDVYGQRLVCCRVKAEIKRAVQMAIGWDDNSGSGTSEGRQSECAKDRSQSGDPGRSEIKMIHGA